MKQYDRKMKKVTDRKNKKKLAAIEKELVLVTKQEEKLKRSAEKEISDWKVRLEKKVPQKTYDTLQKAFCKAFSLIFEKGTAVIEKGYNDEGIREDFEIQNHAVEIKGRRKELRKIKGSAQKTDVLNMAITTVEGIGLGALGIGLPDIVIFVGMLLKGIYETALHYGIDYNVPEERFLILKMMEVSLSKGAKWEEDNQTVDELLMEKNMVIQTDLGIKQQTKQTASIFAMDMLVLKFIQGLPIVGIVGGAANPVYYNKVLKYIKLKYQKRYLLDLKRKLEEEML